MEQASALRVVALIDLQARGYPMLAFLHLRVGDRAATDVGGDLAQMDEAIAVSIATGPYGVIVAVVARDGRHLADILGKRIPRIAGVEDVRCELALDVMRFGSTWALLCGGPPCTQPPDAGEHLDELDVASLRVLEDRGARTSYRRVAAQLGVADATVRARLRRMETERLVRFQAVCDAEAFGMTASAYVGIQVQGGRVDEVADHLLARSEISTLVRCLGDYHFVSVVQAPDRQTLIDTVLTGIATTPGVRRIETSEIWRLMKHTYALTHVL
jgi:Lrp/AsnC family transcriptional regulator for asnA, asnC and gidA